MINLANHQTSCDFSTYSPTTGFNTYYLSSKPKQTLVSKKTTTINNKPTLGHNLNLKLGIFLHNFKIESLLCWRSDIWYLNLRCGFLNLISACHMIWTVVKNNGKIAFVNHGGPQDEKAHLSLIDLVTQTQIQAKAVPRLKKGILTLRHKPNKPNKANLERLNSKGGLNAHGCDASTYKNAFLKTMHNKQQKPKVKQAPLLELCSLLKDVELTGNKYKSKHSKLNLNDAGLANKKSSFDLSYELCQSKVNVLKSRLNLITYADETAPAKGYFSNSDATFKAQLSHLLPLQTNHSHRAKNILLMRAKQSASFKNCKRFALTPLDLSKSLISCSRVLEQGELMHRDEHTYVQDYGSKHMTRSAFFGTHVLYHNVKNKLANSSGYPIKGYVTYSQRYYGKVNPVLTSQIQASFSSAFSTSNANHFRNRKSNKSIRRIGKSFLNQSGVKAAERIVNYKSINKLQDIDKVLLKFSKSKTNLFKPKKWFWTKSKTPAPKTTSYCQPYWTGTNVYNRINCANNVSSAKQFATNPFISQANVVVFSHPEKALGLVNQIRNLRIPTIGFVSGNNKLLHHTSDIVDFHILGNPENFNFVTCALQNFIRLLNWVGFEQQANNSKQKKTDQTLAFDYY